MYSVPAIAFSLQFVMCVCRLHLVALLSLVAQEILLSNGAESVKKIPAAKSLINIHNCPDQKLRVSSV